MVLLTGDELTHIATGQPTCDIPKQLVDIIASSGRNLNVNDSETFSLGHSSFRTHLSLLHQISLVSDEHYQSLFASLLTHILKPTLHWLKCTLFYHLITQFYLSHLHLKSHYYITINPTYTPLFKYNNILVTSKTITATLESLI